MSFKVKTFFDNDTKNATHVVCNEQSEDCLIIDPVLNFNFSDGKFSSAGADKIISFIAENKLKVQWILETHIHADHITAAAYLKQKLGGKTGISSRVSEVQRYFKSFYGLGEELACDGSQFDHLFEDGEIFYFGDIGVEVMHTPGHTPACVTYYTDGKAFTGDTFFMPDSGTARCDFPGGNAKELYRSILKILTLPAETRIFINHDYGCNGSRDYRWETTVGEQLNFNIHLAENKTEDQFVSMRTGRDQTLPIPRLMLSAIQINMRGGRLPPPEKSGKYFLKIPVNPF
ncbi:MAG: MBL fold metallo-hydrolase [Rhodospirillaceae bacterium]|jgi:glyoxylase-like metal-dependent hydrolase (beta-lactamase superfamily II)|nr:MBL fold metallo-hydrolase [Rhodospirillaceae bacterium]